MNEEKEVYFDQYCKSCKYHGLEESKDPCNDCLAEPSNTNSHKPMNYESKNNFRFSVSKRESTIIPMTQTMTCSNWR